MATNFPTSIDAPHDPVAGESMASGQPGDLAVEITNLNDRTVAIENALGTTSAPSSSAPYRLISRTVLGTAVASVTFSSIPSYFENLRLVIVGATAYTSADNPTLRFNGDAGANYDFALAFNNNSAWTGGADSVGLTSMQAGVLSYTGVAPRAGQNEIRILGYARTTFRKYVSSEWMGTTADTAGGFYGGLARGQWRSTAAINSITCLTQSGTNYLVGSVFSLYGEA